jgi:hypothetical protein
MSDGWIGVDLDGTLAVYHGWKGELHVGEPIWPMVERVKNWLAEGKTVKIMTARAGRDHVGHRRTEAIVRIQDWCEDYLGQRLTNEKDFKMIELWDDRAVQVEFNTGQPVTYWTSRVS